ncbi:MAG: hypothetical protein HKL80_02410 [Acidimicrobiales bacterium]|nr:hypothetical protein [Acidimicrobiales bacterium]
MEIDERELLNRCSQVIEAVRRGELVVLTVCGEALADIVPHGERPRWFARRVLEKRACS